MKTKFYHLEEVFLKAIFVHWNKVFSEKKRLSFIKTIYLYKNEVNI